MGANPPGGVVRKVMDKIPHPAISRPEVIGTPLRLRKGRGWSLYVSVFLWRSISRIDIFANAVSVEFANAVSVEFVPLLRMLTVSAEFISLE